MKYQLTLTRMEALWVANALHVVATGRAVTAERQMMLASATPCREALSDISDQLVTAVECPDYDPKMTPSVTKIYDLAGKPKGQAA